MDQCQEDQKQAVVKEFHSFIRNAIRNCVWNVTMKMSGQERRNSGISVEEILKEEYVEPELDGGKVPHVPEALRTHDHYGIEDGIIIEMQSLKVTINDDTLSRVLEKLSVRELQALVMRVGFDLEYDEIAKILGTTPEKVRTYKYQGLRKTRSGKRHD